jgi:hypothetical protein
MRIVDRPGPSEVRQSFVQICSKRVTDGLTLARFMRKTYGRRLSNLFAMTRLGGVPAYRTRSGRLNRTLFLQTQEYRLQLVAGVVAAPTRRAKRLAQVNRILASFSLTG